ncbi:hypothetical protein BJ875DRAFT_506817 [Amylocarpus encephaloides]|uniref:IgE-binding protein n=1 Tax=Amylocarpus encephaloides TaxID=45428 RepID=A0A9P7YCL5_9HELO|nr:hypothetical protein BJ875DRAFT_506817 [Amylocarpus encephaloides]
MPSLTSLLAITATTFTTFAWAELFTLTASQPSGPLDGKPVNAAGGAIYIGLEQPATYCPAQVEPNCPVVKGTTFAGLTSLYVEVPGGQQTYVRPEGPLGFTAPHSAFIPPNSYRGGWVNVTIYDAFPEPLTVFGWRYPDAGEGGIAACPTATEGIWQVNAKTPDFVGFNCTEILGLKPSYQVGSEFGAWEYT